MLATDRYRCVAVVERGQGRIAIALLPWDDVQSPSYQLHPRRDGIRSSMEVISPLNNARWEIFDSPVDLVLINTLI